MQIKKQYFKFYFITEGYATSRWRSLKLFTIVFNVSKPTDQ